jgi:hypothetical protein
MKRIGNLTVLSLMAAMQASCDDDGSGSGALSVLLEAEDVITDGIDPGEGAGIHDGWQVRFDKYLITIGAIELQNATDASDKHAAADSYVVDLKQLPEAGLPLWDFEGLAATRYQFHYGLGTADAAQRDESATIADFATMQDGKLTYLVEGTISKADGISCPPKALLVVEGKTPTGMQNDRGEDCYVLPSVHFRFAAPAVVRLGPCEVDEVPGVSIPESGTQTVAITIHGDHLFFNGFPEGGEGGVRRLAQWLADCDLNLDGEVDEAELKAISPDDLAELDTQFQLGGAPFTPLETMWDYVRAQLQTQGHFQGEGECPLDA